MALATPTLSQSQSPSSTTSPSNVPTAPPEVESIISRLSTHKAVLGVLILSRDGFLIRHSGGIFEGEAASTIVKGGSGDEGEGTVGGGGGVNGSGSAGAGALGKSTVGGTVGGSEGAKRRVRYAKMAKRIVDAVGGEIRGCEKDDDVRFLRIRTKRHELMINPDERYILVVVQNPTQ